MAYRPVEPPLGDLIVGVASREAEPSEFVRAFLEEAAKVANMARGEKR